MKQYIIFFLILVLSINIEAQIQKAQSKDGKYEYSFVTNDPLGVRIYTLSNGLQVWTSVNKSKPRIFTAVAVKAGSKNDPADNTGLAHYLEHMLFKGTDQFGTKNFDKEKIYLDQIFALYEKYNQTKDENLRKAIYKQIDSVSNLAAEYAIPNEFDKMCSIIGAEGTNAFTSVEQTVYINDIPSNELDRWLTFEAERYRKPIMRLFHTELEAVYEEKNISLDNDNRKIFETLLSEIFKNHAYGTQTTIGTVEHLKNPSLVKIMEYFNQYYVPNNMAVILCGDFDPDEAVAKVDKAFSYMKPKPVKPYTFQPEQPIQKPIVKTITGPSEESIYIAFRIPGVNHKDMLTIQLIDMILSNSSVGIIDLELNKKQKVLSAGSSVYEMKDYGMFYLSGKPRKGQSLEEVGKLLLESIEKVKKGEFDYSLVSAIIKNMEINKIKEAEDNRSRFYSLMNAFTQEKNWYESVNELKEMRKITKEQIIKIANQYFGENYVMVMKKVGPKMEVVKVEKPPITPVALNRDDKSPFLQNVENMKSPSIKPLFLDFQKDIIFNDFQKIKVHSVLNKENQLFSLYYILPFGTENLPKIRLAVNYLKYLGTKNQTAEDIAKEFYKLGCQFNVFASDDQVYVNLSGLDESFEQGVQLFENLIKNCVANEEALKNMIADELKKRQDNKLNKNFIFRNAMYNWAIYGNKSPFLTALTNSELEKTSAAELLNMVQQLTNYPHKILYYGPRDFAKLKPVLDKYHNGNPTLSIPPKKEYIRLKTTENQIFFVHFDMVQAEIMWIHNAGAYNPDLIPTVRAYNEYFGGGMSSIVFQEIRESKALAYSSYSYFQTPSRKDIPFYNIAYVGTQADKIHDAIKAMNELLNNMPKTEISFQAALNNLKTSIEAERIIKSDILFQYENAQKLGLNYDIRKNIYEQLGSIDLKKVGDFANQYIKNKPNTYIILGSKDKIDLKSLEQYGKVTELTMEQIFGY